MSTYELDDDLVRKLVETTYAPDKMDAATSIADALKAQIQASTPLPPKFGAVIRTDRGVLVRIAETEDEDSWQWWLRGEQVFVRSDLVGRLIAVEAEGVDL